MAVLFQGCSLTGGVSVLPEISLADPYWSYVSYLMSTTAVNAQQNNTFVDSSTNNVTITRFGNTTQGSNNPFATLWSNSFNGSGDFFTLPYSTTNFDWWTTDYTVEYWFYANSLTNASYLDSGVNQSTLLGNRDVTTNINYWSFGPLAAGTVSFYYYNGSPISVTSTATVTANSWNHVAMTKTSSGITIFVNGVGGTTTAISGTPQSSGAYPLAVGQGKTVGFNGYISNLRIVKGTAIYSGNFTPSTTPLTAVANTKLLTCQSSRFADNGGSALVLTPAGTASTTTFSPFILQSPGYSTSANSGSGYFDGTGDYLTMPYSTTNFDWWTNYFTIEAWVYPTNLSTWQSSAIPNMVGNMAPTGNTNYWSFGPLSNGTVQFFYYNGTTVTVTSTATLTANAWTHIAMTKTPSGITIFVNGVAGTTTAVSGTPQSSSGTTLTVGSYFNGALAGYVSSLRIVKGTAIYSGNFTPPTSPLTAVANTSLLMNFSNAGIYDATMINPVETVDNTQVNTSITKFGVSSVYFDGVGDYLKGATWATAGKFGTGDFTVECWVYATGAPQSSQVVWSCNIAPNATGLSLTYYGGGATQLSVVSGGANTISSSAGWSFNAWHHVAIVRSGTTLTMYIDGLSYGSATFSSNCTDGLQYIGRPDSTSSNALQGYIDGFRITRGIARYTSNFNVPTTPFTVY